MLLVPGCGDDTSGRPDADADSDADAGADADADTDADSDGDADADADADTDADSDGDADADSDGDADGDADPEDQDGDGHRGVAFGGDDCDDLRSEIHPGAIELTAWERETIDDGDAGFSVAMAIDGAGAVHLGYARYVPEGSWYATNAQGAWTTEEVDAGCRNNEGIALGPDGEVHMSLRIWADGTGSVGTAVGIGPEGLVHVAYGLGVVGSNQELIYARRSIQNGRDDDCDGVAY